MEGPRDVRTLLAEAKRLAGLSRRLGLDAARQLITESHARGRLDKAMSHAVPDGATDDERATEQDRSYHLGPPAYPE
jgi:hypothetical protein